jgi:hypothetical protein
VTARFAVGDRVAPSPEALRPRLEERSKWVRWASQWASADEAYQREAARRGTVTAILPSAAKYIAPGIAVTWDDGRESRCLDYMVVLASSPLAVRS